MIEGHGDDLYRYSDKVKYNFSTNIVSDMDHGELVAYLSSVMSQIGSYPEPAPFSLEKKIAEKVGISPENVVVTNGATDAMYRIAHIYSGGISAIYKPSFREYQDACRVYDHEIRFFSNMMSVPEADCIWLCNPNNPTGEITGKSRLLQLASSRKESCIVIDQAYADYATLPVLSPKEAVAAGNIILLSSLTKRFAIPGLRIGYVVTSAELASKLRNVGMPWAVNTLAIEAGKYLLNHAEDYAIDALTLNCEALRISEKFRDMDIECLRTDCNFILCRLPEGTAADLKEYLIKNHGILIRDASNFEGLDERYFRVAAQTAMQNNLLIDAVREWVG